MRQIRHAGKPAKEKPTNYRIRSEAKQAIKELAVFFPGMSENAVVERCVLEITALTKMPLGSRIVPLIVKQVDAAAVKEGLSEPATSSRSAQAAEALMRAKKSTEG